MVDVIFLLEAKRKEFEELGVVIENLRFQADDYGNISVHVVNPALPYKIIIPLVALLPLDQVLLAEESIAIAQGVSSLLVRSYWQDILPFILSPSRLATLDEWLGKFQSLPEEIHIMLRYLGFEYPVGVISPTLEYRVLKSRTFSVDGRPHLMPFLDFVNYDLNGVAYQYNSGEISISGKAQDEVFVRYNRGDTFHTAVSYNFISSSVWAYSVGGVSIDIPGFPKLTLGRDYLDAKVYSQQYVIPNLHYQADGSGLLSHVLLGHRHFPNAPRELLELALAGSKWAEVIDTIFSKIICANRMYYNGLVFLLEKYKIPSDHPLYDGLRKQLELLGILR